MEKINHLSVLIVDDNQLNLSLASRFCEILGVNADTASSGQLALDFCSKKLYDLILMDIRMPNMCGIETTKKIRIIERERDRSTPIEQARAIIIGVSASANQWLESEEFSNAGLNDCIPKPIRLDFIQSTLTSISAGSFQPRLRNDNVSEIDETTSENGADVNLEQADIFLKNKDGVALYRKFVAQITDELSNIQERIANSKSLHNLDTLIHELMGSVSLFGFTSLKQKLIEIGKRHQENDLAATQQSTGEAIELLHSSCQKIHQRYHLTS